MEIKIRKAQKVLDNLGDTHLAHLDATLELGDKIDEVKKAVENIPEFPPQVKVSIEGAELLTIKGAKGEKGEKGETGETGEQGEKGLQGIQGVKGEKGEKGESGKDGRNGLNGKDGISGLQGEPGLQGSSDTPEQIRDKLESLKEEERIDFSAFKGVDKFSFEMERKIESKTNINIERAISILDQRTQFLINKQTTSTSSSSGGSGTVTSVISADSSITVTNPTTTVDLSVVSAPKLTTARTINGTSFDGTTNVTVSAAAGTLTGTTLKATIVTSSLTAVGTIATGVWQGTKVGLAYGGTNADLSATGGAQQFLRQSSLGADITVSAIALDDLSDVVIASPATDQILKYNGANWVNGATATVNAGAGVDFYYATTASDISTYKAFTKTPQNVAEQDITVTANNNTVLFFAYASPSAGLGGTTIEAGTWIFDIYAYASLLTLESHILIDVYSRTAAGTETSLFSVTSGTLSSSMQLFSVSTVQQAFTLNAATDRLVVKVSGVTSNISNTTIHFVFGGTTHYSNVSTPLVVRHNDLAGLNGGTSGEYYHLTSAEYTGTGTGNFVRLDSPVFTTKLQAPTIELGAASDTTIARVSAGVISVEGVTIATSSNTLTFTGKSLSASQVTTGTFGTGAYTMDTSLTVPQVFNTENAVTASANAVTFTRANKINKVTNNSAAGLTITLSTTSATAGDILIVKSVPSSAVAQTITWVNTEISDITPSANLNASTTSPRTDGFMWNSLTSKWRCVASC